MKKLFLMLAVLFIALCLFVSCDDDSSDSSVVSAWKVVVSGEAGIFTDTVTFYDDGKVKLTYMYPSEEGPIVEETMTGTYIASSATEGTITMTIDNVSEPLDYLIDGNLLKIGPEGEQTTYVKENANKQAVSTWSGTVYASGTETRTLTVVLYDDGTLTFTINNKYGTDDETIDPRVGIYSAETDTNGTFTIVPADGNNTGSYTIEGTKMTVSIQDAVEGIELFKVE